MMSQICKKVILNLFNRKVNRLSEDQINAWISHEERVARISWNLRQKYRLEAEEASAKEEEQEEIAQEMPSSANTAPGNEEESLQPVNGPHAEEASGSSGVNTSDQSVNEKTEDNAGNEDADKTGDDDEDDLVLHLSESEEDEEETKPKESPPDSAGSSQPSGTSEPEAAQPPSETSFLHADASVVSANVGSLTVSGPLPSDADGLQSVATSITPTSADLDNAPPSVDAPQCNAIGSSNNAGLPVVDNIVSPMVACDLSTIAGPNNAADAHPTNLEVPQRTPTAVDNPRKNSQPFVIMADSLALFSMSPPIVTSSYTATLSSSPAPGPSSSAAAPSSSGTNPHEQATAYCATHYKDIQSQVTKEPNDIATTINIQEDHTTPTIIRMAEGEIINISREKRI